MPTQKLKEFLDNNNVKYVTISHSPAFTAMEIAESAHIPGKELAKTVIVKIDGRLVMVVVPGSLHVDLNRLKEATKADVVELAGEDEFQNRFPGCEIGAMPPFGNLYDMDIFVASSLAEDEQIAFNAGSHSELVQLAYKDYESLVTPKVLEVSTAD